MDDVQQFQRELEEQILFHYLALDDEGRFLHAPRTDEELEEFIRLAYGVSLPRKVLTPGHRSPFEFLSDLFFERVSCALGFANRAGGKTFTVALLNHLDMLFKPGCEITSAGSVKKQAQKCYRYFRELNDTSWMRRLNEQHLVITGEPFFTEADSTQSRTQFGNGTLMEIIVASEKGFRGQHPHKSRVDEIDEIDWDTLQTGLSMSHSSDTIVGQDVFTSTRHRLDGTMQRLLTEATERGVSVYEWNVWEMVETCERRCFGDVKHGTCPIYKRCEGKAHSSQGFYPIRDLINKTRQIDKDKFEVEWLGSKPSRHKMVYQQFDPLRHVLDVAGFQRLTGRSEPSWEWPMIGAIDFGSSPGHPFVYSKYVRIPNGAWVVWYEYVAEQRLLRDHAAAIHADPFWRSGQTTYADHDAQDRLELHACGVRTRRAVKGPNSVSVGIDYISGLLNGFPPKEEPLLYFMDTCPHHIFEYSDGYRWPLNKDGKPDKAGRPEQINDHCCDCDRYGLYSFHKTGSRGYRTLRVSGI